MKIIISPSKTTTFQKSPFLLDSKPLYPTKTSKLVHHLSSLQKPELAQALHIKGALLDNAYQAYQAMSQNPSYQAFPSFNGLVFKQLQKELYGQEAYNYITKHLLILDALYGVLRPGTLIKPYRLDMKASLGFNLYHFWNLDTVFSDDVIINLASTEFSTMITTSMITISFLQRSKNTFKTQATYSKMARGKLLNYMILNQVTSIHEIIPFNEDNYRYDIERSSPTNIVFIRG